MSELFKESWMIATDRLYYFQVGEKHRTEFILSLCQYLMDREDKWSWLTHAQAAVLNELVQDWMESPAYEEAKQSVRELRSRKISWL